MGIMVRYVVGEVLKAFAVSLALLTLFVTLGMGVKEGLRMGLPPGVVIRILPFMLPEMLGITIPVAMLLAVCVAFGRMAGANEIVALKSAGINPLAILWPVAILAFLISLVTVWLYDVTAVWGRPTVRRIVVESVEEIAYSMLRTNRSFHSANFSMVVKGVDGRRLIRPTIVFPERGDTPRITVTAAEAELEADRKAGGLHFVCRNGEVEIGEEVQMSFSGTERHFIPIDTPQRPVHRDWLAMREMPGQVVQLQAKAARAQAMLSQPDLDAARRKQEQERLKECRFRIHRLQTEPHRRWANGFSCLFFALIGAPVAALWRFDNFLAIFFVCFLPILAVYYPLLMVQEDLTTSGSMPPFFFWSANCILLVPAAWLLRRVVRY